MAFVFSAAWVPLFRKVPKSKPVGSVYIYLCGLFYLLWAFYLVIIYVSHDPVFKLHEGTMISFLDLLIICCTCTHISFQSLRTFEALPITFSSHALRIENRSQIHHQREKLFRFNATPPFSPF